MPAIALSDQSLWYIWIKMALKFSLASLAVHLFIPVTFSGSFPPPSFWPSYLGFLGQSQKPGHTQIHTISMQSCKDILVIVFKNSNRIFTYSFIFSFTYLFLKHLINMYYVSRTILYARGPG